MKLKDKFASGIGSILEWYDFALYGYFSNIIAQLFFPQENSALGLLNVFAIYAIGFIARPFGAIIFGSLSDKKGRTIGLKLTPILITIPTFLFSITPTYESVGIIAPFLLVLIRLCQGICISGEYSNNINYLCESSSTKNTFFMGSIGSCCASAGIVLASLISFLLTYSFTEKTLLAYGWRIGFMLSGAMGIIAFILRKNINETEQYNQLIENKIVNEKPLLTSIQKYKHEYLISLSIALLPATAIYFVFTFLPAFLINTLNLHSKTILGTSAFSLSIRLLIIPVIGLLADRIGGIKIARISAYLFLLLSYPLITTIIHYPSLASICLFIFFLITTLNAGTTPGLLMHILPASVRGTMLSMILNISFGIFGGITPYLCLQLTNISKNINFAPLYLTAIAFITLIATFFYDNRVNHEKKLQPYRH